MTPDQYRRPFAKDKMMRNQLKDHIKAALLAHSLGETSHD